MRQKIVAILKILNFEAVIWIAGLAFLFLNNPENGHHFTICPIKNLGFSFCPGCGLGDSISYLFRFEFSQSFHAHPLGIFALIILLSRIIFLLSKSFYVSQNSTSQIIGEKTNG